MNRADIRLAISTGGLSLVFPRHRRAAHFAGLIGVRWYVVEDTTIGGWAIATADKHTADLDGEAGEREVANFISKEHAEHIVALHNGSLGQHG